MDWTDLILAHCLESISSTPIFALTAYALKDEEQKSLAAGCTLHLTKPIKKKSLLEVIGLVEKAIPES